MSNNPIAGVDLEAEQVVEEEAEKPVSAKGKKIRPIFVVFGAILVVEALVLFMVFGAVGGGNPDEEGSTAHADEQRPDVDEASLDALVNRGFMMIGDISNLEPDASDPKRLREVTLTEMKVVFDEKGWTALQTLFGKNEAAEELVKIDLQHHVRLFMSSRGGELIVRRGDTVAEDLRLYFQELNEDAIGGLSQHIVDIGFGRVKSAAR